MSKEWFIPEDHQIAQKADGVGKQFLHQTCTGKGIFPGDSQSMRPKTGLNSLAGAWPLYWVSCWKSLGKMPSLRTSSHLWLMNCEMTKVSVVPTTTLLFWGCILRLFFLMWFRFMAATRHCRRSADYDALLHLAATCGFVGKEGLFPRPPHELGAWEIFGPYTFSNKILLTCFKICNKFKDV